MVRRRIEKKYGIVTGVLMVIWLLLEYAFGLHDQFLDLFFIVTNFVFLIPIVGMYLAIKKEKTRLEGNITLKQGFLTGTIISFISASIAAIGQICYHQFVNRDYFDFMIDKSVEMGVEATQAASHFNMRSYVSGVFISYLLFGLVISLIMSFIQKTRRTN